MAPSTQWRSSMSYEALVAILMTGVAIVEVLRWLGKL